MLALWLGCSAMTLDKAIHHGKVKRRPYRGSKRFDRSCRNHGSCGYCRCSRLHGRTIAERSADEQLKEGRDV